MVIEERDTRQIVFFVIMAFVNTAFASRLATADVPPLTSGYWLQECRSGTLPVLSAEQVRGANATSGVTLFCIASGMAFDIIEAGRLPFLLSKINDCHPFAFAGYRLNGIYVELYDKVTCDWGDTFGYNRITDFTDWYDRNGGVPASYGEKRPHLYGITRTQALQKYGSMVTTFFHYQTPRFGFTPPEQEMLLWALSSDTDTSLSESLCLASVTIRKRWDTIYRRVMDVQPNFFGSEMDKESAGKRGAEKKRRLLSYLEHHMEELRPYKAT
ncbi:MAG: hypothetical protein SFU56_12940 [Capsulimonadales bacterium]|nr:hypothetical protein [Capsulimonadales bacterium]